MKCVDALQKWEAPPDLLQLLNLKDDEWDVLIVGDGSGSRWGNPGGWAAILFDKRTGLRKTFYGALSDTTVNICELVPYIYSMHWYTRGPGKDLRKFLVDQLGYPRPIRVHFVTDCEVIAKQGNEEFSRSANSPLWASLDYFSRLGYDLSFTYIPRDQFSANRLCDALSKDMRHLITSIEHRLDEADIPTPYNDQIAGPEPQE